MTHEIFINYRTGDGDQIALLLQRELWNRFGDDCAFFASKSIPPGTPFPRTLLNAVRRCQVMLALIGKDWSARPELQDENDWVRREIAEALDCAIPVIPVLLGRKTDRLNPAHLPDELKQLAEHQSLPFDNSTADADIQRIGDELARRIPTLRNVKRTAENSPNEAGISNSVNEAHGPVVQGRDFSGDIGGTVYKGPLGHVIKDPQGPMHLGQGSLNYNSPNFSGPGATFIGGGDQGVIQQKFEYTRNDKEEDPDKGKEDER